MRGAGDAVYTALAWPQLHGTRRCRAPRPRAAGLRSRAPGRDRPRASSGSWSTAAGWAACARSRRALGDDERDRLADVAHLAVGERILLRLGGQHQVEQRRLRERRDGAAVSPLTSAAVERQGRARNGARHHHVDGADAACRAGGGHGGLRLTLEREVIGQGASTGDEAGGTPPLDRRADVRRRRWSSRHRYTPPRVCQPARQRLVTAYNRPTDACGTRGGTSMPDQPAPDPHPTGPLDFPGSARPRGGCSATSSSARASPGLIAG